MYKVNNLAHRAKKFLRLKIHMTGGVINPSFICIKKRQLIYQLPSILFVARLGLEPKTPSLKGMCSTS